MPEVQINPPDFDDWPALWRLLDAAFAPMDGRIDPPSSFRTLTPEALCRKARRETLLLIREGRAPIACGFAAPHPQGLYLGKLAVDAAHRRRGHLRALIEAACALTPGALIVQTRIELTENHATFRALGFRQIAATAHPGYSRPTSLTLMRP